MRNKLIIFFFLLIGITGCDDPIQSNIVSRPFRLEASLLSDPYSKLRIPGEFFIVERNDHGVTLGYGGLILGHSLWDSYVAYDLSCQVEASRSVKLSIVDDKELGEKVGVCPKCGTRYLLNSNGVPIGKKDIPALQKYSIIVIEQSDKVVVSN